MTTTLNCLGWMQNQDGQDPCTTGQEVGRLCNLEYTVSVTNFKESNYVPNATMINGCTCSWSIYNLLSACSYCVGQYQYTSWNTWIINCGNYASNNTYLPSGLSLSQGIPFWAITNPFAWQTAVFNVTQATNIAEQAKPDVTSSGPLPTSTTPASSSSSVSMGAIVGGVMGGIIIIIIGGLLIFCVVRRHRRQRMHTTPTGDPFLSTSQPVIVPSTWSQTPVQLTPSRHAHASFTPVSPYLISPIHSTTSLAPTALVSPGLTSSAHGAAPPIADAVEMITPFLATSSRRQPNRSNAPPAGKATQALSERAMAPPGQRARLNPPSYSASAVPGSSGAAATRSRRLSTKKQRKREESVSGTTMYSGHSRTSTRESATTALTGSRTEQSPSRAAVQGQTMGSAVGAGGSGSVDGGGKKASVLDQHPPVV